MAQEGEIANKRTHDQIFKLLADAGLSRGYVNSLLPSWWDNQAASNPAGLSEFKLLLSRNLGVDIEGLSSEEPKLEFRLPHTRRLKRSVRYNETQLTPAISISLSAARMAITACRREYYPLPQANDLRNLILNNTNARYVSLRALISCCWHYGIPVIHVSDFPDGMPKMDGMVVSINDRPAIVLAKQTPYKAWMAFILAHEMGHLSSGHCSNGELLIDESLDETSLKEGNDEEENEADQYALTLLAGETPFSINLTDEMTPVEIAKSAMDYHREHRVDAGHIILSYAYRTGNWKQAVAALQVIDNKETAISDIRTAISYELDQNLLSEPSLDFFSKICGLTQTAA